MRKVCVLVEFTLVTYLFTVGWGRFHSFTDFVRLWSCEGRLCKVLILLSLLDASEFHRENQCFYLFEGICGTVVSYRTGLRRVDAWL